METLGIREGRWRMGQAKSSLPACHPDPGGAHWGTSLPPTPLQTPQGLVPWQGGGASKKHQQLPPQRQQPASRSNLHSKSWEIDGSLNQICHSRLSPVSDALMFLFEELSSLAARRSLGAAPALQMPLPSLCPCARIPAGRMQGRSQLAPRAGRGLWGGVASVVHQLWCASKQGNVRQ